MKSKIIAFFTTIILSLLLFFVGVDNRVTGTPIEVFQVYLNGDKVGLIANKEELLELIDKEQSSIKEEYNVEKVYPPNGLNIQKVFTYNDNINDVETIYEKIKDIEPFTIEGYTVTITYTEKKVQNDGEVLEPAPPLKIYMLEKEFIDTALYNTAAAFIGTSDLINYEESTQKEITDTGEIITSVFFEETMMVKKDYISTEEYIFKNADLLSQYLLFGTLETQKTYETKEGENLDAIADANNLNIEELLIANPQYTSANVLLAAGEKVNVGLISPLVSVVYRKTVIDDISVSHKTEYIDDSSKYTNYKEVTTKGQDGKTRITQDIKYINGEIQSLTITKREVIAPAINQVITRGTKILGGGYYYYENEQGNADWSWPTISPFVITSRFKWRWGRQHQGIDISGCGYGSPIYAVQSGKAYRVNHNSNLSEGLSIYIEHADGTVTVYMHLAKILVKEGQTIKREQKIGLMGSTGVSTGTHLHLGVFKGGRPYQGGRAVDPCREMFKC